jgi:hypothetical protein
MMDYKCPVSGMIYPPTRNGYATLKAWLCDPDNLIHEEPEWLRTLSELFDEKCIEIGKETLRKVSGFDADMLEELADDPEKGTNIKIMYAGIGVRLFDEEFGPDTRL